VIEKEIGISSLTESEEEWEICSIEMTFLPDHQEAIEHTLRQAKEEEDLLLDLKPSYNQTDRLKRKKINRDKDKEKTKTFHLRR
jgi:hypothetical protein